MDEEKLVYELKQIKKLLAHQFIENIGAQTDQDKIYRFHCLGLENSEIAEIMNKSNKNVSAAISNAKKAEKKGK